MEWIIHVNSRFQWKQQVESSLPVLVRAASTRKKVNWKCEEKKQSKHIHWNKYMYHLCKDAINGWIFFAFSLLRLLFIHHHHSFDMWKPTENFICGFSISIFCAFSLFLFTNRSRIRSFNLIWSTCTVEDELRGGNIGSHKSWLEWLEIWLDHVTSFLLTSVAGAMKATPKK